MHVVEMGVLDFLAAGLRVGGLGWTSRSRAAAGATAHYAAAARRPADYRREVPVRLEFEGHGLRLVVRGRIDALLESDDEVVVEEIKATWRPLDELPLDPDPHDAGQLQLYHHALCTKHPGRPVAAVLTYVLAGTGQEQSLAMGLTAAESAEFAQGLAQVVLAQEAARRSWLTTRDESIRALHFPFPTLRAGQAELLAAVRGAIRGRRDLLVEAATGIGKTMAALYPAVRGLSRHGYHRIFYLTAKTAGAQAARAAVEILRGEGLRLRVLYLVAKDRLCPLAGPDRPECAEGFCPYADDFFGRVGRALPELLEREEMTAEAVLAVARRETLCPFELSLELSLASDLIVADYNYAFDPTVHLRRFFGPGLPADSLFIVDEAHNLVPRGREMYSATLSEQSLERALAALRGLPAPLAPLLGGLLDRFEEWRAIIREEGGAASRLAGLPDGLAEQVEEAVAAGGELLAGLPVGGLRRALLEPYFELCNFSRIAAGLDQGYAVYAQAGADSRLRLFCLDPGPRLRPRLERSTAAIFLSATLSPTSYFERLLGLRQGSAAISLPSPFPRENRLYLHVPRVSTRYAARDETRPSVARVIADVAAARPGGYLAFFPSYAYLGAVAAELTLAKPPGVTVLVQRPGMRRREQLEFLRQVGRPGGGSRVGLAVMGGLFGEAVDLPGEQLVGTIIVGPALPPPSPELELIREHFDEPDGEGFLYASVVPGMIRVIQAAGRVFRTPTDRGVVVLLDDRFLQEPYRSLLPADWGAFDDGFSTADYRAKLAEFWGQAG